MSPTLSERLVYILGDNLIAQLFIFGFSLLDHCEIQHWRSYKFFGAQYPTQFTGVAVFTPMWVWCFNWPYGDGSVGGQ